MMQNSIIISYYKNIDALNLILKALNKQSSKSFEVIISEDDNNPLTSNFLNQIKKQLTFPLKHVHQEFDNGFRKNEMLNKSLKISEGKNILFLDGDCIPHKHFVKSYQTNLNNQELCFGRRVMIDPITTQELYNNQDLKKLNLINLLFTKTKKLKYALYLPFISTYKENGIWGCNWGITKENIIKINGFDEDYITAGVGEDVDIEWRAKAIGLKFKSIRFTALEYHLHHKENYDSKAIQIGLKQLEQKKVEGNYFCKNGLVKTT